MASPCCKPAFLMHAKPTIHGPSRSSRRYPQQTTLPSCTFRALEPLEPPRNCGIVKNMRQESRTVNPNRGSTIGRTVRARA